VTLKRKRTSYVGTKQRMVTKGSYKDFSCTFNRNGIRLRRFQAAVMSNVTQPQTWKSLQKTINSFASWSCKNNRWICVSVCLV